MGCISSKESNKKYLHSNDVDDDSESRHIVSLTSSSYGLLNMERTPCQGSFLSFHRKSKNYQAIGAYEDFMFSPGLNPEHVLACKSMLGMRGDNEHDSRNAGKSHAMETINTWELMEGLEEECRMPLHYRGSGNNRSPNKPTTHASNSSLVESGSPVWKKYYIESETVKEGLVFCHISPKCPPSSAFTESPRRALACMPFVKSLRRLPSCSSLIEQEDSRSTSSTEPPDGNSPGLKLLLSPATANSPSYYVRPLTKRAGIHAASLSFDGNTEHLRKISHVKSKKSLDLKKRCSRQQSMDSSKGSDGPLFDPSLMATFEQAVMATSKCNHEDWLRHSMDEITTNSSSSDNTWPSSEMASDAESIPHWLKQEKRICAPKISSVDEEKEDVTELLAKYEVRCPTQGDDKVVLYHTSLRGVRKTYEDCCTVRLILKGLGVHVEERDVWMHAKYKEELLDLLGDVVKGVPLVPRLFIKGRYIGGAEEVKQLHENGSLTSFMDGIAMDTFHSVCDGCGDVRFVPCLECSGSCKVRNWNNELLRCLVCNENGLIMCPICTA